MQIHTVPPLSLIVFDLCLISTPFVMLTQRFSAGPLLSDAAAVKHDIAQLSTSGV